MAYKHGDRNQVMLLPPSIEEYVQEDSPVRAYDAIVEALNFQELGIEINEDKVGNSAYYPKSMLKLLVYGYSYGVKSSRKLERACHDTLSFVWLMGGLKPDHKTICEFRRNNIQALKAVLKQTVRICVDLDLVDGNALFVDGSKFRANAGKSLSHSKAWCEKQLEKLDKRIDELLTECESQDILEANEGDYVSMSKELAQKQRRKQKVDHALSELKRKKAKKVNITDPDSELMVGRQGFHSGYNVQNVVDGKEGLIVHSEAVTDRNDLGQFEGQVNKAMENTGKICSVACADSGYANTPLLEKIDEKGIHVVVPTKRQALHKEPKPFDKVQFTYDRERDCYYCPEGHRLRRGGPDNSKKATFYKIEDYKLCRACKHYGECTTSREGRRIRRYWNEATTERFEQQFKDSQEIYELRKQKVELPFGHIKHNLGYGHLLLRGLENVQGEVALVSSCFNMARMIGKFGVQELIHKISRMEGLQYA
ncbi:MAG: IS1182 family transposase [Desulfobacterales bacterium]|nr:IS1182 family transposase [Desulfobacterales bacterium]